MTCVFVFLQLRLKFDGADGTVESSNFKDSTGLGLVVRYPPRPAGIVTVTLSNSLRQQASVKFAYQASVTHILAASRCLSGCIGHHFRTLQSSAAELELHLNWPALEGFNSSDLLIRFGNSFGTVVSLLSPNASSEAMVVIVEAPIMRGTAITDSIEVQAQLTLPTGSHISFPFTYCAVLRPTTAYFDELYGSVSVSFNSQVRTLDGEFPCAEILTAQSIEKLGTDTHEAPQCSWSSSTQLRIGLLYAFDLKTGDSLTLRNIASLDSLSTVESHAITVYDSPSARVSLTRHCNLLN